MTLTENDNVEEKKDDTSKPTVVDIGQVLANVMKEALDQERITFGVFECADVLEACPEQVMLCILPKIDTSDVMISIQHKLIEAHCWENDVNLVKVDSSDKLMTLLLSPEAKKTAMHRTMDFSCLLIRFPLDEMSSDDFQITKYSYLFSETDTEPIPLPD